MPIISRVGRRSAGPRIALTIFYVLLTVGAVTMIYPLLLMMATAVTGPPDIQQFALVPRYLYRDRALFLRVICEKYLGPDYLADNYGVSVEMIPRFELDALEPMVDALGGQIGWDPGQADERRLRQLAEYEQFLRTVLSDELVQVGFEQEVGTPRLAERRYWDYLARKYGTDIASLNRAYGEDWQSVMGVPMPKERAMYRNWVPNQTPRYADYVQFKREVRRDHPEMIQSVNGDVYWRRHLQNRYDGRIGRLNHEWNAAAPDFDALVLPLTRPANPAQADAWDDFVRRKWPPRLIRWDEQRVLPLWRRYLRKIYTDRVAARTGEGASEAAALRALNTAHGTAYASFEQISLPATAKLTGPVSADFFAFIRGEGGGPELLPATRDARLLTLSGVYRQYLRDRYGDLPAVNSAYGTPYVSWNQIAAPAAAYDWWGIVSRRAGWRWYLVSNNFHLVLDRIVLHGDALANTVAFIVLSIVVQLTVNPLCAYALSRFNLRHGSKVLLFLLATMAFPAEVTMIPSFLLLRDLSLLNTFLALLLPAAAGGFMIFILKGFFDTLPREVYEAAQLDGAGELRMFAQITMPMCQPVLAYIALVSFTSAYMTFLFAMVVCQDSRMWTLMVWIYQLQGTVHESAQIAALLVVMIPTLLVLAFCQRIIMRGVVLPQMQ